MNDLRQLLRSETHASHARVDELYSQLDLTTPGDYRRFLTCNLMALLSFDLTGTPFIVSDYVREACALLLSDLKMLGGETNAIAVHRPKTLSPAPIAALYVLGGASFGQRILQMRWQASKDIQVQSARNYLRSQGAQALWKAFLHAGENSRLSDGEKCVIVNSANRMFDVYAEAFLVTRDTPQPSVTLAS